MKWLRWRYAVALGLATGCLPCLPVSGGTVGIETPARVETARNQQEAKAALERVLPEAEGRLLLVSPNDHLSSLLLPLRRSGALKQLVTILPSDNVLGKEHLDAARSFIEQAGLPAEERGSLLLDNGVIRGKVEGMPVVLSTLASLVPLPDPVVLVLDTSFLPALYRNEVKTPMLDLAWKLVVTLRERKVRANAVVLFDATGRGDFPLEHGFLAPLLREMISSPEAFADGPPEKWRTLKSADAAYFFSQYADGMERYRAYLGDDPSDASACYKIAVMASRDLDVGMVLHWLNRAASIDSFYRRAYSELAGYFFRKDLFDASETILLAGLSRFPKDPLMATNLAALYLSRGEAARQAGDTGAADGFYGMAAGVEGAEPQVRERARFFAESLPPATPATN